MEFDVKALSNIPLCCLKDEGQPKANIQTILVVFDYLLLHTKLQPTGQLVMEKKKGFYHLWDWQPYWSCDLDAFNIFLFLPTLAILLTLVKNFLDAFGEMYKIFIPYESLVKGKKRTLTSCAHKSLYTLKQFLCQNLRNIHIIICISIFLYI